MPLPTISRTRGLTFDPNSIVRGQSGIVSQGMAYSKRIRIPTGQTPEQRSKKPVPLHETPLTGTPRSTQQRSRIPLRGTSFIQTPERSTQQRSRIPLRGTLLIQTPERSTEQRSRIPLLTRTPTERLSLQRSKTPLRDTSLTRTPTRRVTQQTSNVQHASRRFGCEVLSSKKKLMYTSIQSKNVVQWTEEEDEALTHFILLSTSGKVWPATKNSKLWEGASTFLHNLCGTVRTSKLLYIVFSYA